MRHLRHCSLTSVSLPALAWALFTLAPAASAGQEPRHQAQDDQPDLSAPGSSEAALNKLTYHNNAQRTGWNAHETILTSAAVSGSSFGLLWATPQLDSFDGVPPRLFASPLYVDAVQVSAGQYEGSAFPVIYAVTSTGNVYAINAFQTGAVPPGEILWRKRLTERPCYEGTRGNLSTPVIDLDRQRLYVTSCDDEDRWQAHAIDIRSSETIVGWPLRIDATALNVPGVNKNGTARFPENLQTVQRGALNLSPDQSRLYVTFGEGATSGWIVAIDTDVAKVATAFSSTAVTEEHQGGMWASGGPSVDEQGDVYIATGANIAYTRANAGFAGMFPDSPHSWGQSILKLVDSQQEGFELAGTYTPFNYCQAGAADIDLGSSGAVVIDLDPLTTSTPNLLALGGAKQGNVYLLDRASMPGSLDRKPPCSDDSLSDLSLLSPEPQPHFGQPGPINVFGPYSETHGMIDQAKSRSTLAYLRDRQGTNYLFVTGSSKTGDDLTVSVPPGLARLEIVTTPGQPAHLRVDQLERAQTLHNPGSPIVTSNGGQDAIVWVLDTNAPKSTPLHGPNAPEPVLYAFDALNFRLLWKSEPGELSTSGKYNEPTVVRGTVFVGTDRLQAFGAGGGRDPQQVP